jgi:hypothetical protein
MFADCRIIFLLPRYKFGPDDSINYGQHHVGASR